MKKPVKILHIDLNWKIFYLVVLPGTLIKTPISLETTLDMVRENNSEAKPPAMPGRVEKAML